MAVRNQVAESKSKTADQDIIFMGYFNLELTERTKADWLAALRNSEGLIPFQQELTTLSIKAQTVVNNYDHFILNPETTKHCNVESISSYNYLGSKKN